MTWILTLSPQPVDALLPFSIEPSCSQNSAERPPFWPTGDWWGLSSSSNQPGVMQHFPPTREPCWGPYPLGWLLTQGLGSTGFFRGLLMVAASPAVASSMGGQWKLAGLSHKWLSPAGPPGILPVGLHHSRWCHQRRRCMAPSLLSASGCSMPKGMVCLG